MARSKLLVHPRKSANGLVHRITPKSAGWTYVGFEARDVKKGEKVALKTGAMEACVVILSGKARVTAKDFDSGVIGERASAFEGMPWSVYLPAHTSYAVEAETNCEFAVCLAPGTGKLPARVI